jgi:hypothetical protein
MRVLGLAITESTKGTREPVTNALKTVQREFGQSRTLIERRMLAEATQQLQSDSMESLDDLRRRYIPMEKSVKEAVEENKKRKGVDAFNRTYLLRDAELDRAVAIMDGLNHVQVLERDVMRKVKRFAKYPQTEGPLAEMDVANRSTAAASQATVATLLSGVGGQLAAMGEPAAPRVREAGVGALMELKLDTVSARIAAGGEDEELAGSLETAAGLVDSTLSALKDLLGERVKPKEATVAGVDEKPPEVTLEDWRRMRTPEYLRQKLEADTRLPAEVRRIMLRALSKEFPEKYKELLAEYYGSFIGERSGAGVSGPEGTKEGEK